MNKTIELKGHLDTSKVAEVKAQIDAQMANVKPEEHVVIDCSELEYISSSGLRIMLMLKQRHNNMELIGVNSEVYNVFLMTGFTRILDVKKALRKIDISACKLIGEGGNGAAYRINDEEIVKVCKHSHGEEELIHESNQVREAFLMGVPTVISFDTVDCGNGRKGIVMEALDSQSVGEYIAEDPSRMDDIVPKYVEVFRKADAVEINSPLFKSTKEALRDRLMLPQRIVNEQEAEMLLSLIDEIPESNHFVHFDGHVGNVLMCGPQDNRNLMIIDFGDSGVGHPVLEISGWAFMMLEPEYGRGCTAQEKITGMSRELNREFARRVLAEMFHPADDAELDDILHKASLVGRIKAACIAQFWYSATDSEKFKAFSKHIVEETLTLVPEIKDAIRYFVDKL